MKRVLVSLVAAGALLGQLGAVEIYKDGDKSFGVFGVAKALLGYGFNNGNAGTHQGEFISGIQGNSRIGINFKVGNLFGAGLIGLGESTLYGAGGNTGFRHLYAGYDFGDAGKLTAGKKGLVTSMGGFSSTIFNTDAGLKGFGGLMPETRRLQIEYAVAGISFAISENDFGGGGSNTKRGYEVPRFSLGYEYKDSSIRAKVVASYAHKRVSTTSGGVTDNTKNAVYIGAGVRPVFGDSYMSVLLGYGYNAEKINEVSIATPILNEGFQNITISKAARKSTDTNLATIALEYGVNLTNDFAVKIGGGYQYAKAKNENLNTHSYSAFVQLPYKVGGGFSIIPEVGYVGTTTAPLVKKAKTDNVGNVLAAVQVSLAF